MVSKVTLSKSGVTVLFGCGSFLLSGVEARQAPFGANILITGENDWLVGTSGCTVFKLAPGEHSDAIGFLHEHLAEVSVTIEFDGNRSSNTSVVDGHVPIGRCDHFGFESRCDGQFTNNDRGLLDS